jgi:hypothetical protein
VLSSLKEATKPFIMVRKVCENILGLITLSPNKYRQCADTIIWRLALVFTNNNKSANKESAE